MTKKKLFRREVLLLQIANFTKKKIFLFFMLITLIILISISAYFGYRYFYNKNAKVLSMIVVNQTGSSATVVWQTDREVFGYIELEGNRYRKD